MIISRTPFRISFLGGGTDYPSWYLEHGGTVLGVTIDKYCYLTCRYLPPFFKHRIRVVYSHIENCQTVDEIAHPAVREVMRYLGMERGVEIHHDGDLPARSGMGSSSSFTVGLLHALHALNGYMPSKRQLALEGIRIEQDVLKETVGSQDQVLAAFGGFNHIVFSQSGDISVTPVTLSADRLQELSSNPYVDELYSHALANGALGGKLLGAGGGGFILLFVPPSQQEKVRAGLKNLINVPFRFEFSGSQIIFFEPERDYSAEEKLRAAQEFNFLGEATNLPPLARERI
jgi:galactokinase/mevalonate kinase-like predicted kinase